MPIVKLLLLSIRLMGRLFIFLWDLLVTEWMVRAYKSSIMEERKQSVKGCFYWRWCLWCTKPWELLASCHVFSLIHLNSLFTLSHNLSSICSHVRTHISFLRVGIGFVTLKREYFLGALDPQWFALSIAMLSGYAMEQILTKEEPLLSCVLH